MLSDGHRFILSHTEVITASALHVYYSALPFVPKKTLLFKTYSEEGKDSIGVLQGVESNWPRCLSTLTSHSIVTSIAFSPDGLQLASGSVNNTIELWDAVSGAITVTLSGDYSWDSIVETTFVVFSPNGLRLASGSSDGKVRLWDALSGRNTATLEGHSTSVTSVTFSPDGLQLASAGDNTVCNIDW